MKFSRRGILGGLFATATVASAPPASPAPIPTPKQTFAKGMIVPRFHLTADPRGYSLAAMVVTDYEIFDGEKFVPFNSTAGQQVIADLT